MVEFGDPDQANDIGGSHSSDAVAINNAGQSVGFSKTAKGQDAVLWSPSGTAIVLHDAGGKNFSGAVAINASGHSVGFSKTPTGGYDAVRWSPSGAATVLHDAGGQGDSQAVAENNNGWSVGFSLTTNGQDAVLWSPTGTTRCCRTWEVKALAMPLRSISPEIARLFSYGERRRGRAVVADRSGDDLGAELGSAWTNTQAVGINDVGDILGYGDYRGEQYGFVLTPSGYNLLCHAILRRLRP